MFVYVFVSHGLYLRESDLPNGFSPHPGQAKLNQLRARSQELRLDILRVTELWVEIIWSNSDNDSIATELARCKHLAHLSDLIAQELWENWETFRHHTNADLLARTHSVRGRVGRKLSSIKGVATDGSHVARRAVTETERPDSGCREGVCKELNSAKDEWFTRYVSTHWPRPPTESLGTRLSTH